MDRRWRELVKLEMYLKIDLTRIGNLRLRRGVKRFLTSFYHEQLWNSREKQAVGVRR